MKERIAQQLPYPVSDADPENSEMIPLVNGRLVRDKRTIHLPDDHSEYDLYLSVLRGGNGLGDVLERDPQAVVRDLNEGYLLPRFASSTYGVIAHQDSEGNWILDADATTSHREQMRKERLAHSVPVEEWLKEQRLKVEQKDFIAPVSQMYSESMALSTSWAEQFRTFWNLPADWTM